MATSVGYGSDPEWTTGSEYYITILLPKQDLNYPIHKNGMTSYVSWHFEESEPYKWLEENCFGKYIWQYDNEVVLDDDRAVIHITFIRKEHADEFSNQFETCNWNFEKTYFRPTNDSYYDFIYNWTTPDDYDIECEEILQWCRENITDEWAYRFSTMNDDEHLSIYFLGKDDAVAFKLRWM